MGIIEREDRETLTLRKKGPARRREKRLRRCLYMYCKIAKKDGVRFQNPTAFSVRVASLYIRFLKVSPLKEQLLAA